MDILDCLDAVMEEPIRTVEVPPPTSQTDTEFTLELLGLVLGGLEEGEHRHPRTGTSPSSDTRR